MARILVIDNEAPIRNMLVEMLRADGHEAYPAGGASEAKSLLAHQAIDLILMDIYMPEMNGLALMKEINQTYTGIETILISGRHTKETESTAKQFGAFGFLTKPFTRNELSAIVDAAASQVTSPKDA